jgi:hypothetical protein
MQPLVDTTPRVQRMERECAASAGQARLLGLALAVLVVAVGLATLLG